MPINDKKANRRWLYDTLNEDNFNVGTYEEFDAKMNDESKRRALYDYLSNQGNNGTWEDFESRYGNDVQTVTQAVNPQPQQPTNAEPQTPTPLVKTEAPAGTPTNAPTTDNGDATQSARNANATQTQSSTPSPGVGQRLLNIATNAVSNIHMPTAQSVQAQQSAQAQSMVDASQMQTAPQTQQEKERSWVWRNQLQHAFDGVAKGERKVKDFGKLVEETQAQIQERNDPDEINAYNAFIEELTKQQQAAKQNKSILVKTGFEKFSDDGKPVTYPFKFNRNNLPNHQDYVRTLRSMANARTQFNVLYNIADKEVKRDYDILTDTANVPSTMRPTDYMFGSESPKEKARDFRLYAAYIYHQTGEFPSWADFSEVSAIRAKSNAEVQQMSDAWGKASERNTRSPQIRQARFRAGLR